jgi:predicted dehydrogenase
VSAGVAIIGCGLVGSKRAAALSGARLVACADLDETRAAALARTVPGVVPDSDWRAAIARPGVDIVVVATTNEMLTPVAEHAVEAGKHVLV